MIELLNELTVKLYNRFTEISDGDKIDIMIVPSATENFGLSFQNEGSKIGLLLFLQDKKIVTLTDDLTAPAPENSFDQFIFVALSTETEQEYYRKYLTNVLLEAGHPIKNAKQTSLPENIEKIIIPTFADVFSILKRFGYDLTSGTAKPAKKAGKPRHKWSKEVSQIEFSVSTRGASANVYWHKRNEMLIKKGAIMNPDAPLNKDGSLGFSARFAEQLRQEHAHQFKDFVTTEDIIVKSVNEVGLFLYFGGTNSWLELVDDTGKSINEWTVVE